jgi:hypothetical protein
VFGAAELQTYIVFLELDFFLLSQVCSLRWGIGVRVLSRMLLRRGDGIGRIVEIVVVFHGGLIEEERSVERKGVRGGDLAVDGDPAERVRRVRLRSGQCFDPGDVFFSDLP